MVETKKLALAKDLYHWPGMVKDIKNLVWACPEYERYRISKLANPYLQTLDETDPWQQLGTNLAQLAGKYYIVVIDSYSGWPSLNT